MKITSYKFLYGYGINTSELKYYKIYTPQYFLD